VQLCGWPFVQCLRLEPSESLINTLCFCSRITCISTAVTSVERVCHDCQNAFATTHATGHSVWHRSHFAYFYLSITAKRPEGHLCKLLQHNTYSVDRTTSAFHSTEIKHDYTVEINLICVSKIFFLNHFISLIASSIATDHPSFATFSPWHWWLRHKPVTRAKMTSSWL